MRPIFSAETCRKRIRQIESDLAKFDDNPMIFSGNRANARRCYVANLTDWRFRLDQAEAFESR
jgi:hypothetical protein